MKLQNKIALITGASRGIGYAVAKRYIEEGAHVIITARTVGALEELDDYAKSLGSKVTIVPLDLCEFDKIDHLGYQIYQRFGRLDILVANAGMIGEVSPVGHISPKSWEQTINLNLTANWRLLRSMDALLRKSEAGRVLITSSAIVNSNSAYLSAYSVSKAGLEALAKTYQNETQKTNIKISLIYPGSVRTALRAKAFPGEDVSNMKSPDDVVDLYMEPLL